MTVEQLTFDTSSVVEHDADLCAGDETDMAETGHAGFLRCAGCGRIWCRRDPNTKQRGAFDK